VEKAGLIAMVRVRQLGVDEHYSLRGKTLEECIRADKEKGLIPFLVCRIIVFDFSMSIYIRYREH
jgi:hypothetical protein